MGALDDLLLSQQPMYSDEGAFTGDLFPQPAAPAQSPLENFDTGTTPEPSPLDFMSVGERLGANMGAPVTPPAKPEATVPQVQEAQSILGSMLTHGDPWGPNMPTAYATPVGSYPITQTFMSEPGEYGVDLATPVGTPIRAPWDGVLRWEQSGKSNWGNRALLKGENGWTFGVGHLSRFALPNGARVKAGQVIGYSGGAVNDPNSGNTTGPHIEPQLISPLGYYVNPLPWLQKIWGVGPSGQPPRAGDFRAGLEPGPTVTPKRAGNQPVVATPNAFDPRQALVQAEVHGGHAGAPQPGAMAQLPPAQQGGLPSLGDVLGRIPGTIGTLASLPSAAIGKGVELASGLTPVQQLVAGAQPTDNDIRKLAPDADASGQTGHLALLFPKEAAQLRAQGASPAQIEAAVMEALRNSPNIRQMITQNDLGVSIEGASLLGLEAAGKGMSTLDLLRQTKALGAARAALQNKAADALNFPGMAQGIRQKELPGIAAESSGYGLEEPPKFTPQAINQRLAAQRGQLQLGEVRPEIKAGAQKGFDLLTDFDKPGQGLKETVAALQAGLWGGKVNEAHQALQELASTPPEQQQLVALNRVMRIDQELRDLYDRRTAGEDVDKEITNHETLLAVYSKAARDVVSGWSHELGPTMRHLIDAIWHPYALKADLLGGDAMPKDPVLAIRYQGGMRNAVFALGDMVRQYMRKNVKSPQEWDDLAWEMEHGNRAENRPLETKPYRPGPAVVETVPAAEGGLRRQPTGTFQDQRIIPDKIKSLATLLRASNDALALYLTEQRKGEFFKAMRDNFWSRKVIGWRDPVTGKEFYKKDLARLRATPPKGLQLSPDSPHFEPRTLQEGLDQLEQAGWIVLKNPAHNVPEYFNSVAQAVANKNILDILKTSLSTRDGRPIAIAGNAGKPPPGAEGYHHILPNLNAWVHPDAWKMVESQFDQQTPGKVLGAAHRFGEVFRQVNMINPLVHTINQYAHQLFQSLVPLRLWILGHQLAKDPGIVRETAVYTYIRPRRAATEYSEAMKGVVNPGVINPFSEQYRQDMAGSNLAAASGHVALDTALLPLREAVDAGHTFLFEFVIRNAQMAMYALEKEKLLKMGMDPEQARLIAGIRADRLVGAIDPMTKNQWERKWASLAFFAYNWSKTHVMQALESTPALGRHVLAKEHPFLAKEATRALEEEMTWAAYRGITTALFQANAINMVLAGHPMWQNEAGRELDWEYTQFARDHLGYTGSQRLYIDAMPMRWLNFFWQPIAQIKRTGEFTPGGVAEGLANWGQTKLMPPLTTILSYMNDDDPNKTAKLVRAVETAVPLQRQLSAVSGDSVLGPQTPGDLAKAVADINQGFQGGQMSPEAQRFLLNLSAFVAGENPVKKGPVQTIPSERQKGYAQAQFDRRVALELATNQHIGWATAGELAKEKARRAVMNRPDGGEAEAQRQEDHFKQLQTKAIAEMAAEHNDANLDQVDLSPAAQDKMRANGQNPMDLLDNFEKAKIFAKYPELSLYHQAPDLSPDERVRAVKTQTATYHVRVAEQLELARAQQDQIDAQLRQGVISFQQWRDARTQLLRTLYDKNVGSVTSLARELPDALTTKEAYDAFQKSNGAPVGNTTRRDLAYNAYKAILLDDPKYTLPDGSLDPLTWKTDRDKLLSSLPEDEQRYVKLKEQSSWTDVEFLYHQLANRYLEFEQQHADAVHLYHQMFQETNTVQARKKFEAQHPAIYQYIVARNAFLRHNPLVAEAFAHGSILARALATHGVNPGLAPAQQIAKLLSHPQPGLDLNRPGTTQEQLQQEFAQNFGQPPAAQQLPHPAVDLTSLLQALQQPGAGAVPQASQRGELAASLYQ